jgi:hypothetical protein
VRGKRATSPRCARSRMTRTDSFSGKAGAASTSATASRLRS